MPDDASLHLNAETHKLLQPWNPSFRPTLHTKILRNRRGKDTGNLQFSDSPKPRRQPDSIRDRKVIGLAAIPSPCLDPPAILAFNIRLAEIQRGRCLPPPTCAQSSAWKIHPSAGMEHTGRTFADLG